MVAANDLIMIFIGLEISSIASYILAGYLRNDKRNNEAAVKYFLLGSFATAFLLYGVALIYGVTGTARLDEIRTALNSPAKPLLPSRWSGWRAALMFVGLGFRRYRARLSRSGRRTSTRERPHPSALLWRLHRKRRPSLFSSASS